MWSGPFETSGMQWGCNFAHHHWWCDLVRRHGKEANDVESICPHACYVGYAFIQACTNKGCRVKKELANIEW